MGAAIRVEGLSKTFRVRHRTPGLGGALRHVFAPKTKDVPAVEDVTFSIEPGERVAFVGPNGAGKSTTIKMLTGILHPSSGTATVAGLVPWKDRRRLGFRIGTVFGQRSQLWWHLPRGRHVDLLARVYEVDDATHRARRARLVEAFALGALLEKPVRSLSLGERMRCEVTASLLHAPDLLFLDEPTIGLDVVAKAGLRDLVRERSRQDGCTVLLASHDTGDMESVCERVLVIHRGRLLLDRPVSALRRSYIRRKVVTLATQGPLGDLALRGVVVRESAPHRTVLDVDTTVVPVDAVVQAALAKGRLEDLSVEDPPMEEIVKAIYASAESSSPAAPSPRGRSPPRERVPRGATGAVRQVRRRRASRRARGVRVARGVDRPRGLLRRAAARLLEALEGGGPAAAGPGAEARDLLWYLAVTEWVLLSVPSVHLDVERDVRTGDVAYLLPRPMSYLGLRVAEAVGTLLVRLATLGVVGGGLAFLLAGGGPSDPRGLAVALALGPAAGVLAILFQAGIGVLAVWLHDVSPVYWIWQKAAFVLGGLVLPLHLYPDWLQTAARFTPFSAMLYGPGRMAMGFDPAGALRTALEIVAWSVAGALWLRWLSGRALRVLDVNGG